MKSYSHLISKLFNEPLLVTPARHTAICQLLEAKLAQSALVEMPGQTARLEDTGIMELEQVSGDTVIIPVHGTIVQYPEDIAMSECGCDLEGLNNMIDAVESTARIKRVIYDFRTPGGGVTGVPETARKILYSKKETIAFTDSECCSGGLWLAAQCENFYATESSRVGSCGVYCMTLDMSKGMKKDGMKVNAIFAGKYKLLGASFKPLEDDERAILQAGVDKIYKQFKEAMNSHRMVSDDHYGNGLVFNGQAAAEIGFTDGVVENIDEIIDGMVE